MFAASKTAAVSGAGPDDKFNYVTMLLHGDGTNGAQNNTFLDSSTNNFTITRNGNTTQGTFTPYGANWSVQAPSTSTNYLTVGSAVALGSSDYTVEFWFAGSSFEMTWGTPGGYAPIAIPNSGTLYFADSSNSSWPASVSSFIVKDGSWNHYAIVRQSGAFKVFRNGTQIATPSGPSNNATNGNVVIGYYNSGMSGFVSNFRAVVGTAVYTSAFTPPTAPLTAITNTQLLTCQSNRFIDNSTNNYTITATGSPRVQRFNPFGSSTAYSTSVIGGSGYFDGSGDSLKVAYGSQMNLTNQDFAIEFWAYIPTALTNKSFLCQDQSNYQLNCFVNASNNLTFYSYQAAGSQNFAVAMGAVPIGAWTHFVIARTGSTVAGFKNGSRIATASFSGSIDAQTGGWYVGSAYSGNGNMTGYLSDVRFVIGSNPYGVGTTLTVPTAPLPAVTNTQFLSSFINAGILDNAMMNDLETVGNAQISTSVKKYGTGSLVFDGNGDYLLSPNVASNGLGNGNFTVEFWVYVSAYLDGDTPLCIGTFGTWYPNIMVRMNPNWTISVGDGSSWVFVDQGFGTKAIGSWAHIAITRSSGTLRAFLNGVQGYSVSNSTDMTLQQVVVGNTTAYSLYFNGYIDDLRITKGFARYTSNFTAPTAALPDKGPY